MATNKSDKKNKTMIGGQAVIEGVMMRGKCSMATAVRDSEGTIRIESKRIVSPDKKSFFLKLPIIRGIVNFVQSMIGGTQTLMRSSEVFGEEEEPSKFEKWLSEKLHLDLMSVITTIGLLLGLGLSILLFVMLPQWITNGIATLTSLTKTSIWFNLIEGGIRICVFVAYILITSLMKDIRRTYMYHGAEHKTISCFEKGLELTPQNAKTCTRLHNRCGTTFLFFVMLISILVFSLANSFFEFEGWLRMLLKIALLPLVAGLSYELLRALAKTDCFIFWPLKAPGLLLQRITTREPTDDMLEVAIAAFKTVLAMDADETIAEKTFVTALKTQDLLKEIQKTLSAADITENSEAEWIVSICTGIKRSMLAADKTIQPPSKVEKAFKMAEERASGRPLWYIVGDTDFYGYRIFVDESVLIPRPETEELVEYALENLNTSDSVLDLCTGSGAIAITINKKCGCSVTASDISESAIEIACKNAEENNAQVTFIYSDLFTNINEKFSAIITNPPYIPSDDIDHLQKEVRDYEPRLALDGGIDGLDYYRSIAKNSVDHLFNGGLLFLECGINQAEKIVCLLKEAGFQSVETRKDAQGVERMIKAML